MHAPAEIEQIVREVVRRLRENNGSPEKGSQALAINDRVVAMATIEGRLAGVRQLVVPQRSVVTPAVRDELRQRNITIVRSDNVRQQATTETLLVGVAVSGGKEKSSVDWMKNESINVQRLPAGVLPNVVERMIGELKQNNRLGLLVTDQPVAALCLANRQGNVRAALGCSTEAAREAVETIGTNLLVIDPRKKSHHELRGIARQFAAGGSRECPESWKPFFEK